MLSAAAAAGAAASFIGSPQLRSPSCRPLPVRCSVTALEGGVWSTLALAKDALPEADVLDLDLLDGLILTPLLVPILGLVILRSGAAAAGAKLAQFEAQRNLETAEGRIKKLEAKVAERDEKLVRKAEFWSDQLAKARGEPRPQAAAAPRKPIPKPAPVVAAAPKPTPTPKPTPKPKPAPAAPPPAATVGGEAPAPWNVVTRISKGVTQLRPGLTANDLVLVTGAETQAGACMQPPNAPPPTPPPAPPSPHRLPPTAAALRCAGKLVVAELLRRVPGLRVRACGEGGREALEASLANIEAEACAVPKSRVEADGSRVEIVAAEEATELCGGVTAVVWAASSAGVGGRTAPVEGGVGGAAAVLREASALLRGDQSGMTPKLVLLSTAATSRVGWSRETKKRYPAAAELPIVRFDPQNILGVKAREEAGVRAAGLPYCIVRPCNLDEEYVSEGGYVLSSGDVATGRISHRDVAALLVSALLEPGACGKTLEAVTLPTLPKRPLAAAFRALPADREAAGSPPPEDAAYSLLQQLAPP